jgi:hypothetical protein
MMKAKCFLQASSKRLETRSVFTVLTCTVSASFRKHLYGSQYIQVTREGTVGKEVAGIWLKGCAIRAWV